MVKVQSEKAPILFEVLVKGGLSLRCASRFQDCIKQFHCEESASQKKNLDKSLYNSWPNQAYIDYGPTHTNQCRLSRRPRKGQRLICLVFFDICFSLWFRSDSLSVSSEPELQIHCVFQGFLFFFSNVLFFSMQTKVLFLRSGKIVYFLEFMQ